MAKIKSARSHLIEALQKATFSSAVFGIMRDDDLDYTIKKETLLYRQSWLIPPIMAALRDLDPCKRCDVSYRVRLGQGFTDCLHCGGTGIAGGLPFDPYELARKAAEKPQD